MKRVGGWAGVRNGCGLAELELVTVYSILPGRGSQQLKQLLGADYDSWLVHDGLRCYSKLEQAGPHRFHSRIRRQLRKLPTFANYLESRR